MRRHPSRIGYCWTGAIAIALAPAGAWAQVEILGTRPEMPGEGYLQYQINPASSRFGEEVTGWIDVRHPVLDGTTGSFEPYDRSNHFINEHSILMQDSAGSFAAPQMLRDWDRSSKIFAQAGISTPRISSASLQLGVTWANFNSTQRRAISNAGTGRAAAASTLNMYYAKSFSDALTSNGLTISAFQTTPGSVDPADFLNPYSFVRDVNNDDTQAHEAGHQLLNGPALHMETPGTPSESDDTKNFMYKFGADFSFQETGRNKGKVENVQITRLYANGGANNPGYVQRLLNQEAYGHRVDWNYVQDDYKLEAVGGTADDHPGTTESLYFAPGTTTASSHTGHDHTGLDNFKATPDFAGTFRFADVISLTTRYADFDRFSADGDFSIQNGGLDYQVFFQEAANPGNIVAGTLTTIYDFGWTTSTIADNYLGRWMSPFDAMGMFVFPKLANGVFDGNTQIDAVIVSNVPEPGMGVMMGIVGVTLLRRRLRELGSR